MASERTSRTASAVLIHLTKLADTLDSILQRGTVVAKNAFGAIHENPQLRNSQLVACFSAIEIVDVARLADRRGEYGVALDRT
jgi:hypothetical protein